MFGQFEGAHNVADGEATPIDPSNNNNPTEEEELTDLETAEEHSFRTEPAHSPVVELTDDEMEVDEDPVEDSSSCRENGGEQPTADDDDNETAKRYLVSFKRLKVT